MLIIAKHAQSVVIGAFLVSSGTGVKARYAKSTVGFTESVLGHGLFTYDHKKVSQNV